MRASFFDEIASKVERKNENVTLDHEMRESHQLCEDMFIFSKVKSPELVGGTVGRVVVSSPRGPGFESNYQQFLKLTFN